MKLFADTPDESSSKDRYQDAPIPSLKIGMDAPSEDDWEILRHATLYYYPDPVAAAEAWVRLNKEAIAHRAQLAKAEKEAEEAYERGYSNGYARQKYDADWDKVEANL